MTTNTETIQSGHLTISFDGGIEIQVPFRAADHELPALLHGAVDVALGAVARHNAIVGDAT